MLGLLLLTAQIKPSGITTLISMSKGMTSLEQETSVGGTSFNS